METLPTADLTGQESGQMPGLLFPSPPWEVRDEQKWEGGMGTSVSKGMETGMVDQ